MPTSVIEAFASGLAVVSTQAGGIPAILTHGSTACSRRSTTTRRSRRTCLRLLDQPGGRARSRTPLMRHARRAPVAAVRSQWLAAYRSACVGRTIGPPHACRRRADGAALARQAQAFVERRAEPRRVDCKAEGLRWPDAVTPRPYGSARTHLARRRRSADRRRSTARPRSSRQRGTAARSSASWRRPPRCPRSVRPWRPRAGPTRSGLSPRTSRRRRSVSSSARRRSAISPIGSAPSFRRVWRRLPRAPIASGTANTDLLGYRGLRFAPVAPLGGRAEVHGASPPASPQSAAAATVDWHFDPVPTGARRSHSGRMCRISTRLRRSQGHLGAESTPALARARPRLSGSRAIARYRERCLARTRELARRQPAADGHQLGEHAGARVPVVVVGLGDPLLRRRRRLTTNHHGCVDLLLALDRQLAHVERNLSYYFSPNTHLLGEALALYVGGRPLPELAASGRRAALGRKILLDEIAPADRRRRRPLRTLDALSPLHPRLLPARARRRAHHRRAGRIANSSAPCAARRRGARAAPTTVAACRISATTTAARCCRSPDARPTNAATAWRWPRRSSSRPDLASRPRARRSDVAARRHPRLARSMRDAPRSAGAAPRSTALPETGYYVSRSPPAITSSSTAARTDIRTAATRTPTRCR